MPFITAAIAAIGLAASIGGTIEGISSAQKAASAQEQAATAEEQIAQQNQQQLTLDASRQRREIARQSIIARSSALSNATNQGGAYGASSGLQGGYGGIENQGGSAMLASNQNLGIGMNIFGLQQQVYQANSAAAGYMGQQQMFSGISNFGSMLTSSAPMIGKIGGFSGGWGTNGSAA